MILLLTSAVLCSPFREDLSFHDSQGLCWICDPSGPCRLCDSIPNTPTHIGRMDHTCPEPRCTADQANFLFPVADDPTRFWQCNVNGRGRAVQRACECGTYFNWATQQCDFPWNHIEMCDLTVFNPPIPPPRPCNSVNPTMRPPAPIWPEQRPPIWTEERIPTWPDTGDTTAATPILPPLSTACSGIPDCNIPTNHNILFPLRQDPTSFWQCAGAGTGLRPVMMDCQCGTFFWFQTQRCEFPSIIPSNQLCGNLQNVQPRPCDDSGDLTTITITPTTTTTTPPQICVPCIPLWPCTCTCIGQTVCGCNGGNRCNLNNFGQNVIFGNPNTNGQNVIFGY